MRLMHRNPARRRLLTVLPLVALAVALAACGDNTTGPEASDVDGYVRSLPSWSQFAPPAPSANVPAGDPSDPAIFSIGSTEYACSTTPYSLTETPDRITIFNPDSEIMWLGALLQGRGHRDGLGSLAELPIRQRGPLKIFIDLLSESNAVTVENPDASSVSTAIGTLIADAEAAGHHAGSNTTFDLKETYSLHQASLELGVSTRYLGTDVESELSYQEELEENTLTAYFVQRMFTTSMVLPQTPGEVFSPAFTRDDLQAQIDLDRVGPDNLPTYISNIVWGRMLMVTMTSTYSFEEMEAALTATNETIGGGSISGGDLQVINESTFRISTVGGNDEGVENLIRTGQLSTYFDADLSLTQARPLSYTVRNLGDNSVATVSETTVYNLKTCETGPAAATGARYKLTLDKIIHNSNGCDGLGSPEYYYSFSLTTSSGTNVIASLPESASVTVAPGGTLTIGSTPRYLNVYRDGRQGDTRFTGTAYDDDVVVDDVIGTWNKALSFGMSTGQKSAGSSGHGCSCTLYWTVTRVGDLYD